jgi:hypothetical protein
MQTLPVKGQCNTAILAVRLKTFRRISLSLSGSAAEFGLWPPHSRGFMITHNDAPQSVGLLWTSDQLVAEIST